MRRWEDPEHSVRLFVAVRCSREMVEHLTVVQRRLEEELVAVHGLERSPLRPVAAEKLHITVAFLGEQPADCVEDVATTLREIAESTTIRAATVSVAALGAFPSVSSPRVVWMGVNDSAGVLEHLSLDVRARLGAYGVACSDHRFVPHITLAYLRRGLTRADRRVVSAAIRRASEVVRRDRDAVLSMAVDHLSLVESRPTARGRVYVDRETVTLPSDAK